MKKENEEKSLKFIDTLKTDDMVEAIHNEIIKSVKKLKESDAKISKAIDLISKTILNGGKLYVYGCHTPARIAIIENLEMRSLFSLNQEIIQTNILGGDKALKSIDAEPVDSENTGRAEIVLSFVKDEDVLIILNTRDNFKYSKGALMTAEQKNIPVILISQDDKLSEYADISIVLPSKNKKITTLSETGISNLFKITLNIIFNGVMIKIGKVFENNIIDPNTNKHKEQAVNIVMKYAKTDEETAVKTLEKCKYHPKVAVVMLNKGVGLKEAINLIKKKKGKINGFVK